MKRIKIAFGSVLMMISTILSGMNDFPEWNEKFIAQRSGIPLCCSKLAKNCTLNVAFLGGSITEMYGYSDIFIQKLRQRFPLANIIMHKAGIASTCSDTGAARLQRDVLIDGRDIDLLFVEFAVNDNQDGGFEMEYSIRAMEGIVRQAKRIAPDIEIVFIYCANESHIANFQQGKIPHEIVAHEQVARHYSLPSICFAAQVADDLAKGKYDWKTFGGVHPAIFGAEIYVAMLMEFVENSTSEGRQPDLPAKLDSMAFEYAKLISSDKAEFDANWSYSVPQWNTVPGAKRERYTSAKILHTNTPGAKLKFEFQGTAVGFFTTAGIDAGKIKYSIDGQEAVEKNLFRQYSDRLHYPYTVMLADKLPVGRHTLTLECVANDNGCSAVRIFDFTVNQSPEKEE